MKLDASELFKLLSADTRIKIIELLKNKGEMGAKAIAEELGITVAAVSQHLKALAHAGLLEKERKGFHIPYSINEDAMENCRGQIDNVCNCKCGHVGMMKELHRQHHSLRGLLAYEKELKKELQRVQSEIRKLRNDINPDNSDKKCERR